MALGRKLLLLAAVCGLAWSQSGLTTIQDTLFKADGTRFNGTLTIQWSTFDATNIGTIVQQSRNVRVVNGNLLVQLVPNATQPPPANVYSVEYESDGRQQSLETWTIPVSSTPLTVSQVRVNSQTSTGGGSTGGGGSSGNSTSISESSVIGLQADLAQRPQKGVAYGSGAVAMVDANGFIETVVGDIGDCVFVDGTTGPCAQQTYSDAETPGGTLNGVNNTFTLANPPQGSSLLLFRNGLLLSGSSDYTLSGTSVTFAAGAVPLPGDSLTAFYRIDTSGGGSIVTQTAGGSAQSTQTIAAQVLCNAAGTTTALAASTSVGSCDIPAGALQPGDRIEARFTLAHSGTNSGFNFVVNWGGNTPIVSRTASSRDTAISGDVQAAITSTGAQISVESFGTLLPFLPGIVTAPFQPGLKLDFRVAMVPAGSDSVTLTNYTVLRYPGH